MKPAEALLLDEMAEVARRHAHGAGIVYTLSRSDAEKVKSGCGLLEVTFAKRAWLNSTARQVAQGLYERGLRSASYHAGCAPAQRRSIQTAWQAGQLQIVVATIAFGLGIDKPGEYGAAPPSTSTTSESLAVSTPCFEHGADVRFVLHHTMSKSLEAYYQVTAPLDGSYSASTHS